MIPSIVRLIALLLFAPMILGIINRTKAILAGRKGQPLLQPYFDIAKLLRKGTVRSTTTTWIFFSGPVVGIAAAVVASLFLPLANRTGLISFEGDMLIFIYLFALARFFVATAAMDTGSAFEGMGAAREVTFSAFAEPAMLFGLLALARSSGSLNLSEMLAVGHYGLWQKASASAVLIVISWFLILLAENCRIPFDDPNTHLELTMIHEVMVLDHSGPAFGLILYASALKLSLFGTLIINIILPIGTATLWMQVVFFTAGMIAIGIAVGIVESVMARLRLLRIPQLLITASLLSAFAVVLLLR
jgi:formate hydrogenlyase subunit 4